MKREMPNLKAKPFLLLFFLVFFFLMMKNIQLFQNEVFGFTLDDNGDYIPKYKNLEVTWAWFCWRLVVFPSIISCFASFIFLSITGNTSD